MDPIEKILLERPAFHRSETEIERSFDPKESLLPPGSLLQEKVSEGKSTCYGIEPEVVRYLAIAVGPGNKTLETGAGITTLAFALKGACHVCVTPNVPEIEAIRAYAQRNNIRLDSVEFVADSSDHYLPRSEVIGLDLVLLDGKHAFPWPMVDWFYTADRLKQGGLMVIDDARLRSVGVLAEFMVMDPGWRLVHRFGKKTLVFKKMRQSIHDVAWHMQPWTVAHGSLSSLARSWGARLQQKLKRLLGR